MKAETVVEFIGGPDDGLVAATNSPDPILRSLAKLIDDVSENGKHIGKRIEGYSIEGMRQSVQLPSAVFDKLRLSTKHTYAVRESHDFDGVTLIRVEYEADGE